MKMAETSEAFVSATLIYTENKSLSGDMKADFLYLTRNKGSIESSKSLWFSNLTAIDVWIILKGKHFNKNLHVAKKEQWKLSRKVGPFSLSPFSGLGL